MTAPRASDNAPRLLLASRGAPTAPMRPPPPKVAPRSRPQLAPPGKAAARGTPSSPGGAGQSRYIEGAGERKGIIVMPVATTAPLEVLSTAPNGPPAPAQAAPSSPPSSSDS